MSRDLEVIVLCGGIGSRLSNGTYPKPMGLVRGRSLISRVLRELCMNLPNNCDSITFVVNQFLTEYNFKSYIISWFQRFYPSMKDMLQFYTLPFETRGALESLYCYLKANSTERQVLILDNDNLYMSPIHLIGDVGLLYTDIQSNLLHFSYLSIVDSLVTRIEEKRRLSDSDKICVGYYLSNISDTLKLMQDILLSDSSAPIEFYTSCLYQRLLDQGITISSSFVHTVPLGTLSDISNASQTLIDQDTQDTPQAIFDLDETIISDGKPVSHILNLMRSFKNMGWRVVIYTARGMRTANGKAVTDSVMERVMNDLDSAGLIKGCDYDDIYFNKPYGEVYIDDKAYNTYDLGLLYSLGTDIPRTADRYNLTQRTRHTIIKHSDNSLDGEINYYNLISKTSHSSHFPTLKSYGSSMQRNFFIETEYIPGPTISSLLLEDLLTPKIFIQLLDLMDSLHDSSVIDNQHITDEDYQELYITKLVSRQNIICKYEDVYHSLNEFLSTYKPHHVNLIHGDLWFRNVILCKGNLYLIDMRGLIGSKVTVQGDRVYDYAKIYQSLVGLDHVLNNSPLTLTERWAELIDIFETRYKSYMNIIKPLCRYTMYCSIPSWENKYWDRIIEIIKTLQ